MDQLPAPASGEPSGPVATDRRQAERRTGDRRKAESASVRALLAVLFAVIAVLFAALGWWQQSAVRRGIDAVRAEQQKLADSSAQLRAQVEALAERDRSDEGRLNELSARFQAIAEQMRQADLPPGEVQRLADELSRLGREQAEATQAAAERRGMAGGGQ